MKQFDVSIKKINLLYVLALIAGNTLAVGSASAFSALLNPSFEADSVSTLVSTTPGDGNFESAPPPRPSPGFVITSQANVSNWKSSVGDIELWQNNFDGVKVAPGNGNQFAEINASSVSTLFQDLTIAASATTTQLYFNFWHRARRSASGDTSTQVNAIRLTITDNAGAGAVLFNKVFATQLNPNDINTTNNGWANYDSSQFLPFFAGISGSSQTIRFSYAAVTGTTTADLFTTTGATPTTSTNTSVTTTNTAAYGNFIDNANFADNPTFINTPVPFDFSPNLAVGVLGGLYVGSRVLKSLKNKKDIN